MHQLHGCRESYISRIKPKNKHKNMCELRNTNAWYISRSGLMKRQRRIETLIGTCKKREANRGRGICRSRNVRNKEKEIEAKKENTLGERCYRRSTIWEEENFCAGYVWMCMYLYRGEELRYFLEPKIEDIKDKKEVCHYIRARRIKRIFFY